MEELDIPIFNKAYELYKTFYGYRSTVSRQDRYTLWQRGETTILDILEGILLASQFAKVEKLPVLQNVSLKVNFLRIFVRLTKDVKAIDNKKHLRLQEMIDEIGRMLGGWIKSTKERFGCQIEQELPGSTSAKVVVVVVIRVVVDIEPVGIEVANVDAVTVRRKYVARSRPYALGIEVYVRQLADYILSALYFIREQLRKARNTSPRSEQEVHSLSLPTRYRAPCPPLALPDF